MMLKCAACGAAWTSLGLPICPMCGAKVEPPPGVSESGRHERIAAPKSPTTAPVLKPASPVVTPPPTIPPPKPPAATKPSPVLAAASPVLKLPSYAPSKGRAPEGKPALPAVPPSPMIRPPEPAPKPPVAEAPPVEIRLPDPTPKPAPAPKPPATEPPPVEIRLPEPTPPPPIELRPPLADSAPLPALKIEPPAAPASDFGFDEVTIQPSVAPSRGRATEGEPCFEPPRERVPASNPPPVVEHVAAAWSELGADASEEDDTWYCSLPRIAPPPKRAKAFRNMHAPIRPSFAPSRGAARRERPVLPFPASTAITELVDASVLVHRATPRAAAKPLPAPARPLTVPLVLGVVAALACVLLPLTAALERNRVVGVLGFCICGLLVPLAPVAWIAGLEAERRRREQGLRVERRVVVGRLLAQWGTLVLAAEGAIFLLLVAALRIIGKIPITFPGP